VTRVLKVPERAAAAQPDAEPALPWSRRKHQVNGSDRVSGTYRLVGEAEALISLTSWAVLKAQVLVAQAEVNRLAGARGQAAVNLREALRIYQNRRAAPLAEQTHAVMAALIGHIGTKHASAPSRIRAEGGSERKITIGDVGDNRANRSGMARSRAGGSYSRCMSTSPSPAGAINE
jgi:hypothetical protein